MNDDVLRIFLINDDNVMNKENMTDDAVMNED